MERNKKIIDLTIDEFESLISSSSQVNDVLDVDSCARFLHKKPQTIYKYVSRGIIPFNKKEGSIYFLKSELINWIKDGK